MSIVSDPRQQTFDPFGEPLVSACVRPDHAGDRCGFAETRKAAIAFWVAALVLLAGRVYLTDEPGSFVHTAASALAQVASLH